MNFSKKAFKIAFTAKIIILIICFASTAQAELKIDSAYPTLGLLGQDLEVTLKGDGFDVNTRVSIYPDSGNKRAIIGSVDTPGAAIDVTVVGTIGYVAGASGLQVIDVSNSASPKIIGSVKTPGYANGVAVVGTEAYVAEFAGGLQVIDVSNPANPQIIGSVVTPGWANHVTVVGTTVYVADWNSGLQVIDASTPSSPKIIGSVATPGNAISVTVVGTTAYVADGNSGLQVIDVSSPASPQIIGSMKTPGDARGVTVVGTIAYVNGNIGLQVIDVSNPASLKIIGSVATPRIANCVAVVGTTAYVADNTGLQVIDVNIPASPKIISSVATPGWAFGVTVVGTTAYVADNTGLQVIDVNTPASLQIIGSVDTPGDANGVTVVGTTAYVVNGFAGLQVIDISNPASLQIIGSVKMPDYAHAITIQGNMAYVADDWYGGLQVIDVSNPAGPKIIGSVKTPGAARGVTVVGTTAYVTAGISLQVIDVSNPASPKIIGSVDTPDPTSDITVVGTAAYVADNTSLQVIDVSALDGPKIIGFVKTPGYPTSVAVVGTTAYVGTRPYGGDVGDGDDGGTTAYVGTQADQADEKNGLQVIDVSNPASLQIIGSVDTPGYARGVTVVGTTAYVANDTSGLQAIDVSNPTSPQIIGSVDTPGYARGVTVVGTTAYVADGKALVIVPVPTEIMPVTVNNITNISVTLPSPIMAGHYTLRVFNETESDELVGAVSFTEDLQIFKSKAIIVAGGGPNAPGEIWEDTKQSANKAYNTLVHEGYDHNSIYYLTGETGNQFRDGSSLRHELDWAINSWTSDASELVIFFVDHGLRDKFVIYDNGQLSQHLNVTELDNWLDNLQQNMIGTLTFIYDACHSGTFASKLIPPPGKDRIIITGASDEPAYFRGEDSFSFQFWEQILLQEGNVGYAFSAATDFMKGYQSPLINADGDRLTNEEDDDFTTANSHIIRRGQPIYLKPAPTIGNVIGDQTLNGSSSATIWVSDVREVESVWAKIIPPDINPDVDGIPITDLPTIELQDTDHDGTYDGAYHDFTTEGTYTIIINAQTSQEIFSYVQEAMVTQVIPSPPVFTSVTQMNGDHNIKADSYEMDDTYPQANVITLNDLDVQPHNFHDLGDVDWVKFYGLSGQTYSIKAGNVSVICNVVVELFDSDGITRLKGPWNETGDGEDEIMEWTCMRDDVYYVKLSNANATFGENCKYDLKLYRPIGPAAGFVTGIVKNAISKQALGNVQIKTSLDQSTLSHSDGSYLLVHPPGTFTVTAQLARYNSKSYSAVKINEGDIKTIDIVLDPSPTDTDKDGILDAVEYASSCLNADDADTDNDGIVDGQEDKNCNGIVDPGETHPCNQDTDGDGMPDGWEVQYNLNPLMDNASEDADADGYSNLIEYRGGSDPTDQFSLPQIRSLPWIPLLLLGD